LVSDGVDCARLTSHVLGRRAPSSATELTRCVGAIVLLAGRGRPAACRWLVCALKSIYPLVARAVVP